MSRPSKTVCTCTACSLAELLKSTGLILLGMVLFSIIEASREGDLVQDCESRSNTRRIWMAVPVLERAE